jgi:ATP-dependent protease HslVU (ClpYQ) peptidase subunit
MPTTIHITDQGNQTISGELNLNGNLTVFRSGIFSLSGAQPITVPNNPISAVGSGNTYVQVNIQNRATGAFASADLVITANNGTDTSNYINLGINNSGYNDPTFTNGTGFDGYLFIDGGNLDIGTRTPGRFIEFHAGGTTAGSTITRISESGLNLISGNLTVFRSGIFSLSGAQPITVPNNPLSAVGSGNTYIQVNIQNRATGTNATADLVITANNGTDTSNYINLGINNSGYNDPAFTNGSGFDGYLFINGGNLDIGTQTPNTAIEFHAGGTTANKAIARINESGLNLVSGNLTVTNNIVVSGSGIFNNLDLNNIDILSLSGVDVSITNGNIALTNRPTVNGTGVLLSGSTPFVITYGHPRDNTTAGDVRRYFGPQMDIGPVSLANNANRRSRIMKDCFLREVSWSAVARDNIPTPSDAMTGYFKNFTGNALTRDDVPGIQVTPAINLPATNVMYNYSSGNLNIPIKSGDYVSFYYQTNFPAGAGNLASGLAVSVDAYFYV